MQINTHTPRILVIVSIFLLCLGMKSSKDDNSLVKIHIVGVTKNATDIPLILLEEAGELSPLKTLHPLKKDSISSFYEKNIREIVYLVETMKVSGYRLVRHNNVEKADPNQTAIVFEFTTASARI